MKTTIDLPNELIRLTKLRAVTERRTVKDLMADFMRLGLGLDAASKPAPAPPNAMVVIGAAGLPIVQCGTDALARSMTLEALEQLSQQSQTDEDMRRAGLPI